jgi:acetyl-CoA synthetase
MGLPVPGSTMAIVDEDGGEAPAGTVGQIAMRPHPEGYYSLGYWSDAARTAAMSRGGWVTIGDVGRRDVDGHFWFEGRADDVIKSADYRQARRDFPEIGSARRGCAAAFILTS